MQRLVLILTALAVPATGFVPGCGGGDDDPLDSLSGFCESWAKRACSNEMIEDCDSSEDECQSAQKGFCLDHVDEDKYSRDGADECLDAVRDAYVDGALTFDEFDAVMNLNGDCELVLSGDGEAGDACNEDSDCDRTLDLICIQDGEKGTCQEPREVGGGESCKDDDEVCESGFYCDGRNCLALPEEGESCSPDIPCGDGFRCITEDGAEEGVCDEALDNGDEGCKDGSDCKSRLCAQDEERSICTRRLTFSTLDDACEDFRE